MTFNPPGSLYATLNESFTLPTEDSSWKDVIISREVDTARIVNGKTNGVFTTVAGLSGEQWFGSNSQSLIRTFRKVVYISQLPNNTTTSYPHGISIDKVTFFPTKLYGVAKDISAGSYLPIPYASSTAASVIELSMSETNVIIKTGQNMLAYSAVVVIEYGTNN